MPNHIDGMIVEPLGWRVSNETQQDQLVSTYFMVTECKEAPEKVGLILVECGIVGNTYEPNDKKRYDLFAWSGLDLNLTGYTQGDKDTTMKFVRYMDSHRKEKQVKSYSRSYVQRYSALMVKDIFKNINQYENKLKKARETELSTMQTANDVRSQRHWKASEQVDLYISYLNDLYNRLYELDILVGWPDLLGQDRYKFVANYPIVMANYKERYSNDNG